MMMHKPLWLTFLLSLFLVGCGTQIALSGQAREDYLKSIKAYGEHWVKPGMTSQTRGQDSLDCGGSNSGPDFSKEQLNAVRQPGDKNDFAPRSRLSQAWVKCMKEKGYRYTE